MTSHTDRTKSLLGPGAVGAAGPASLSSGADVRALHQLVVDTARLLSDRHCQDVVIFDLRGLCDVTDYIVIATGTSDRQILSVGNEVQDMVELHLVRFGQEADVSTSWLVLDFVDMVVHLFEANTRTHYDLEMLWGDAPRVIWERQ